MIITFLLALMLAPGVPADTTIGTSEAQAIFGPPRWGVTAVYDAERFREDRPSWLVQGLTVRRRFKKGALITEFARVERHGQATRRVTLDGFRNVWKGAYANLRVQAAPGAVAVPRADVMLEVYQSLRNGWEAGAGYRTMQFASEGVHLFTASAGKYRGNWYLRGRLTFIPRAAQPGASLAVSARRYFGENDTYFEALVVRGRDPVVLESGSVVSIQRPWTLALRFQRYLRWDVGIIAGASYVADKNLTRWGLVLGLMTKL